MHQSAEKEKCALAFHSTLGQALSGSTAAHGHLLQSRSHTSRRLLTRKAETLTLAKNKERSSHDAAEISRFAGITMVDRSKPDVAMFAQTFR
jgi:hypothetical protein